MAQRIKGQETTIIFVGPNGTEDGLTDVKSVEVEFQNEILTEGYLGETTNRRDDIFNGASIRSTLNLERQSYFEFAQRVIDRSQRRDPSSGQFNIISTLNFPNGDRVRILFQDVFFGPLPMNIGGRGDYVEVTVEAECAEVTFLF